MNTREPSDRTLLNQAREAHPLLLRSSATWVISASYGSRGTITMAASPPTSETVDRLKRYCVNMRVSASVTFAARLRAPDGHTLDVVVATDLATGRQAVARLSDGARVRCGRVRHEGVETLMAALREAREKNGGASARGTARTATPPKGRGRPSRPAD